MALSKPAQSKTAALTNGTKIAFQLASEREQGNENQDEHQGRRDSKSA
jgi:hypothetical protein